MNTIEVNVRNRQLAALIERLREWRYRRIRRRVARFLRRSAPGEVIF